MSTLSICTRDDGDITKTWTAPDATDDPQLVAAVDAAFADAAVADAKAAFDKAKAQGYLAYRVGGEDVEVIQRFDPTAPQIVMTPQLIGG